jgi:DUF4097 and DUF4098 domain-containing protein YvlB
MRKRSLIAFTCVLLAPLLLHAASEGHFDRTLSVSGAVKLEVTTGSGDITVKSGSPDQVVIHGTIRANHWVFSGSDDAVQHVQSNPPVEHNGSSIRIGYNLPEDIRRRVSISYEITVPPDTALQAHSGSGNIDAAGIRGEAELQTGSGDVRARNLGQGLRAQTGSGSIRVEDAAAPLTAQTGSGDIEASLTGPGDIDVHTGSGSIRLHGVKGGVRARTGSGNVELAGDVSGPWQLHSGSGNISLAVGAGSNFNLNAHTSSGSIHSDLPITVQGSVGGKQLTGKVGSGGPEVEASTSSGDVEIR